MLPEAQGVNTETDEEAVDEEEDADANNGDLLANLFDETEVCRSPFENKALRFLRALVSLFFFFLSQGN